ncbi:MAG TPA: Asp-tRNA(Asn)/Glu-tRNA(Gln) amidotransferase subunit GatB [Thermomicrobiales bacterium]|jgi:aspartyl-tRNA(Asn)/glutamyl-tRNA(Gln) amidotransferase subunit B|nr:Asp-tRNA(Asn)/Glu-tRNA(Gln) amidotransferase subunit GatB [Thermomicrobiales bacterium]
MASDYETVIGLEVHSQLLTQSKMYCGCAADYAGAEPNTHNCPTCLGLPGALPVLNGAAVELALRTGLALNCSIPAHNKLDRKNYVYPDLPKGYQISQYDLPLCVDGALTFDVDGEMKTCGITRVHIEEDTGRLVHHVDPATGAEVSFVDLNRSGVPLMEIVGEPDLRSPEEAAAYLVALRQTLRYIGASTGNMEDGAFRCDANVSLRRRGETTFGAKVEIKNMNSFRAVERALRYEQERQAAELDACRTIPQETRGWVEARGVTVGQRTKEQANDYRYFPEPDLPPLLMDEAMVEGVRTSLPELPAERRRRFLDQYGVKPADAALLTTEREVADLFEAAVESGGTGRPQQAANWIVNDLMGLQSAMGLPASQLPLTAVQLRDLLDALDAGTLTPRAAKDVLPQIADDELPTEAAARLNLLSINDGDVVEQAVQEALAANEAAVADYRAGKKAALGRLIGETMKRTGGRARPDQVREKLTAALDGQ